MQNIFMLPSPYLSDSVFRGETASVSQQSVSSLASKAETVSGMESDGADSSQVGLPPGQFQVVRGKQRKRRRLEAERLATGSPVKPADAKRMVSGRLASPVRQVPGHVQGLTVFSLSVRGDGPSCLST